ncbi:FAD-binding protein [Serinicoccus sediminis]|uniref:FAD-binding protein n=1 Tax=Serinicoccus sediminis TaxID=2306021 RepID=UPI0010200565|nr:FAD-binding protein [Serinicoccus sediminis]
MRSRSSPVPPAAVDALRRTVDGLVAYPTDPAYDLAAAVHPELEARPDVLVVPASEAAVRAAVDVARVHGLRLIGPHTGTGRAAGSDGRPAMMVLTHRLDSVLVDRRELTATVGAGASWASLTAHARARGLAVTSPGRAATVLDSALAGTTPVRMAHVVRTDGFVHVVRDPLPPSGETGPWIVTAVVVALHLTTLRLTEGIPS